MLRIVKSNQDHNVILLPYTVDFYQKELTRLLEEERYEEAARMLQFLLECRYDDTVQRNEWQMLLNWLQNHTDVPQHVFEEPPENFEEKEDDLLKQMVKSKSLLQKDYVEHLLRSLAQTHSTEKQMSALEQLAYAEYSGIDSAIVAWLQGQQLHPHLQFRAIQILKLRGYHGEVEIKKNEQELSIDVQSAPSDFREVHSNLNAILSSLQRNLEINHPSMVEYAEQVWKDFFIFLFGTQEYEQLLEADQLLINVWAGVLHFYLIRTMLGETEQRETKNLYKISEQSTPLWEKAMRMIDLMNKP